MEEDLCLTLQSQHGAGSDPRDQSAVHSALCLVALAING
jgi:hypothetical protein